MEITAQDFRDLRKTVEDIAEDVVAIKLTCARRAGYHEGKVAALTCQPGADPEAVRDVATAASSVISIKLLLALLTLSAGLNIALVEVLTK